MCQELADQVLHFNDRFLSELKPCHTFVIHIDQLLTI